MRRGERAIESKDGQKAILEHCRVCSLAFSGDEYPYVIPLNYGFVWNEDQETPVLYFHGAPVGTKIEHMERDNRAVSYTHLDVYKRQGRTCPDMAPGGALVLCAPYVFHCAPDFTGGTFLYID